MSPVRSVTYVSGRTNKLDLSAAAESDLPSEFYRLFAILDDPPAARSRTTQGPYDIAKHTVIRSGVPPDNILQTIHGLREYAEAVAKESAVC